jgi:8-oxo-dGTP pyrophosphatase MutT (NUDIX family)
LRRSAVGAFAGMWVFPGGRVDDADAGDDDFSRAMSAAIREAHEEVSARVARESLAPWSHWTPPLSAPARFTTWFFVASHDEGDIEIDNHEIVEHRWMAPDQALAAELPMAPPTIVTLHELHEAGDPASIRRGRENPPAYVTRPGRTSDGRDVMMWNGDAGYESGDADADGPRNRLVMLDGFGGTDWVYVRA